MTNASVPDPYATLTEAVATWKATSCMYLNARTGDNCAALIAAFDSYQQAMNILLEGLE